MVCTICKNKFIRTKNKEEYIVQKTMVDIECLRMVNAITDEVFLSEYKDTWDNILSCEAVLLRPNISANKCITINCISQICNYCYDNKSRMCTFCLRT